MLSCCPLKSSFRTICSNARSGHDNSRVPPHTSQLRAGSSPLISSTVSILAVRATRDQPANVDVGWCNMSRQELRTDIECSCGNRVIYGRRFLMLQRVADYASRSNSPAELHAPSRLYYRSSEIAFVFPVTLWLNTVKLWCQMTLRRCECDPARSKEGGGIELERRARPTRTPRFLTIDCCCHRIVRG